MRWINWKDSMPTEILSATLLFGHAAWMTGYDVFLASPVTFRAMASLAPESFWEAFLGLSGLIQGIAVWKGDHHDRQQAAWVAALVWTGMTGMFLASNPGSTAALMHGGLALATGWSYLMLSRSRSALELPLADSLPGETHAVSDTGSAQPLGMASESPPDGSRSGGRHA